VRRTVATVLKTATREVTFCLSKLEAIIHKNRKLALTRRLPEVPVHYSKLCSYYFAFRSEVSSVIFLFRLLN